MAECSYARCVQQRRNIRRELQRWTKNMVHIVGLERIAEELMGRRKWKLYQEQSMSTSYLQPLNNNIKTATTTTPRTNQESDGDFHHSSQLSVQVHQHKESPPSSQDDEKFDKLKDADESNQQQHQPHPTSANQDGGGNGGGGNHTDQQDTTTTTTTTTTTAAANKKEKENEKQQQDHPLLDDRLKDWTPQTKCYFCVDGKLDSEHSTQHGVLSPRHSDSDSSDSHCSDNEAPPSLTPTRSLLNNNNNNHLHHHRNQHHLNHHHHHRSNIHPVAAPANMTTIESVTSMAALAAAFSSGNSPGTTAPHLPFYAPNILSPNWYLANVARFQAAERLEDKRPASSGGGATAAGGGTGGEQPLDLSKGAPPAQSHHHGGQQNNVRLPTLDTKHIFKAKPRMSAVAGRRTYTEDELQAALRDIQSGKLGTRRAAVIYGIPRSTLRNKVYKLALERERESLLTSSSSTTPLKLDEEEAMDDDKELSGAEEEKEVEKALQAPLCDILRFSNMEIPPETLKLILQRNNKEGGESETSEIEPYIQSLLLTSQNLMAKHQMDSGGVLNNMVPEFIKRMLAVAATGGGSSDELHHLSNLHSLHHRALKSNGDNNDSKLNRPSPSNSVQNSRKSECDDMDLEESSSNVILKIPSFRPTSTKSNGDLFSRAAEMGGGNGSLVGSSPPSLTSESGSPPILPGKGMTIKDVKDVIAQSISQKFQQNLEQHSPTRRGLMEIDFKRGGYTPPLTAGGGGISVIKTQDLTRPYPPPQGPKPQQHHQANSAAAAAAAAANNSGGGKGTRPKRGKYRNYDRDSLVEAVRAVQRGEMSVHRAGSYYGVPHSTLEYKVKERHLMRPRKRDPKPNPVDEKIASLKQNDIRNSAAAAASGSPADKLKPAPSGAAMMKPPQKFSPTSPNGIKLPLFEPGMAAPLPGYNAPPFPFWPHPSFHHLPLEYGRNPNSSFPPSPEFFASQMMQKLHEESNRGGNNSQQQQAGPPGAATPALAKSARQIAESLLDGTGSNGSFLDGIIRSSLESGVPVNEDKLLLKEEKNLGVENMSNKALLEQLCRNSRLTPLSKPLLPTSETNSSGDDESYRKSASPLNFATGGMSKENELTTSPLRPSDVHTIELSNDSMESETASQTKKCDSPPPPLQQGRIYLKKDLVNPDNLQPEMLVMRFRDVVLPDLERNGNDGGVAAGSASSDNDAMPQD